jgi:hypothetical protein
MKPELQGTGPNSWDSICLMRPLAPVQQIKRHGDGQRKEICYMAQAAVGRGKVSTPAVFTMQIGA